MTNQLDTRIDPTQPRTCDWETLDKYIGETPFVLLIDEIDALCLPIQSDLAFVLKKYFFHEMNRSLVMTSQWSFLAKDGGNLTAAWSSDDLIKV
jgi:hypothetical protein